MWPPTPTPYPPGTAHFQMSPDLTLWSNTDLAIQLWNWTGAFGVIFQVILLIVLVWVGLTIFLNAFRQMTELDSQK